MTQPPPDLDRAYRLLCAANLAYGVTGATRRGGRLAARPPVLPSPASVVELRDRLRLLPGSLRGYQSTGRDGIDAYLYGETRDAALLAFRGTLPIRWTGRLAQIIGDWLNNARIGLAPGQPLGIPGRIHQGYAESLETLWQGPDGIAGRLDRIAKAAAAGRRLWVTGHSKGGALAVLAALRLAGTGIPELLPAGVVTFGAPRAGNRVFAVAFDDAFHGRAWRFEYQDDIVPHLPLAENFWRVLREAAGRHLEHPEAGFWSKLAAGVEANPPMSGYLPAGRLQFIDWNDRLRDDDTPALRAERWAHLCRALATALPEINRDHLPMRGHGYMDFLAACQHT